MFLAKVGYVFYKNPSSVLQSLLRSFYVNNSLLNRFTSTSNTICSTLGQSFGQNKKKLDDRLRNNPVNIDSTGVRNKHHSWPFRCVVAPSSILFLQKVARVDF